MSSEQLATLLRSLARTLRGLSAKLDFFEEWVPPFPATAELLNSIARGYAECDQVLRQLAIAKEQTRLKQRRKWIDGLHFDLAGLSGRLRLLRDVVVEVHDRPLDAGQSGKALGAAVRFARSDLRSHATVVVRRAVALEAQDARAARGSQLGGAEAMAYRAESSLLVPPVHDYFSNKRTVLNDIQYLIKERLPPTRRANLRPGELHGLPYWCLNPSGSEPLVRRTTALTAAASRLSMRKGRSFHQEAVETLLSKIGLVAVVLGQHPGDLRRDRPPEDARNPRSAGGLDGVGLEIMHYFGER